MGDANHNQSEMSSDVRLQANFALMTSVSPQRMPPARKPLQLSASGIQTDLGFGCWQNAFLQIQFVALSRVRDSPAEIEVRVRYLLTRDTS
ncbi:MAG: hypothetical protein WBA13_12675 [Microcoleaceae cyanobacterium]